MATLYVEDRSVSYLICVPILVINSTEETTNGVGEQSGEKYNTRQGIMLRETAE